MDSLAKDHDELYIMKVHDLWMVDNNKNDGISYDPDILLPKQRSVFSLGNHEIYTP